MYRAIEGLAGKGLLMDGAVGVAVEEAAELGFHFLDGGRGLLDQGLGQVLVVEVLAALEGVHQVLLMGVLRVEHDVEAALNHAAAAAFALERLGHDEDVQVRIGSWA